MVEERRASGRFTLKTDVSDDRSSSPMNTKTLPKKCVGKNATSSTAPAAMIEQT
jgi:hypothetical protein